MEARCSHSWRRSCGWGCGKRRRLLRTCCGQRIPRRDTVTISDERRSTNWCGRHLFLKLRNGSAYLMWRSPSCADGRRYQSRDAVTGPGSIQVSRSAEHLCRHPMKVCRNCSEFDRSSLFPWRRCQMLRRHPRRRLRAAWCSRCGDRASHRDARRAPPTRANLNKLAIMGTMATNGPLG
jgi:hypothetical protein